MNVDLLLRQWKYVLEFYANPVNYTAQDGTEFDETKIDGDKGELARKALALLA